MVCEFVKTDNDVGISIGKLRNPFIQRDDYPIRRYHF